MHTHSTDLDQYSKLQYIVPQRRQLQFNPFHIDTILQKKSIYYNKHDFVQYLQNTRIF